MPGANESSTVEWQSAHWMPTVFRLPLLLNMPLTPTTALSFSSASVVAGSFEVDRAVRGCRRHATAAARRRRP